MTEDRRPSEYQSIRMQEIRVTGKTNLLLADKPDS